MKAFMVRRLKAKVKAYNALMRKIKARVKELEFERNENPDCFGEDMQTELNTHYYLLDEGEKMQ